MTTALPGDSGLDSRLVCGSFPVAVTSAVWPQATHVSPTDSGTGGTRSPVGSRHGVSAGARLGRSCFENTGFPSELGSWQGVRQRLRTWWLWWELLSCPATWPSPRAAHRGQLATHSQLRTVFPDCVTTLRKVIAHPIPAGPGPGQCPHQRCPGNGRWKCSSRCPLCPGLLPQALGKPGPPADRVPTCLQDRSPVIWIRRHGSLLRPTQTPGHALCRPTTLSTGTI